MSLRSAPARYRRRMDILPLLDEALVALPGHLLHLRFVLPRAVRAHRPRSESVLAFLFGRLRRSRPAEHGLLLEQQVLEHEREVVQEVPAIRDLDGIRSTFRQSSPVDVRAIPGSNLYLGTLLEPGNEALLRAFRKKIHHFASFEVHEYRPVRVGLPEGEVVDAERLHLVDAGDASVLDAPEQGIATGEQPQFRRQPGARPAAEFEGDREQGILQAARLAGASGDHG